MLPLFKVGSVNVVIVVKVFEIEIVVVGVATDGRDLPL